MIVWIALIAIGLLVVYRGKLIEELHAFRTRRRDWMVDKWKNWGEPFVVAAVLAILIRTFLLGPYKIPTGSMIPTFMIGDRIFVDKISYRFKPPERGDIIVFKYPLDMKKDFVKRLVGLPGDKVEIREGKIYVNNTPLDDKIFAKNYYYNMREGRLGLEGQVLEVPEESYFVLGDNSAHSSDSRAWGFVPQKNLVGRAFLIWWPPQRVKRAE